METGALSTWTSWITIIGVVLALYVIVWPRIQMWATKRLVWHSMPPTALPPGYEQSPSILPVWCWELQRLLVPQHYRESVMGLVELVEIELQALADGYIFRPNLDAPKDVREIAAYVHAKRRTLERRC